SSEPVRAARRDGVTAARGTESPGRKPKPSRKRRKATTPTTLSLAERLGWAKGTRSSGCEVLGGRVVVSTFSTNQTVSPPPTTTLTPPPFTNTPPTTLLPEPSPAPPETLVSAWDARGRLTASVVGSQLASGPSGTTTLDWYDLDVAADDTPWLVMTALTTVP